MPFRATLARANLSIYPQSMTRVRRAMTSDLDDHVACIVGQVRRSIRDGQTRSLAVKLVSDSYDYARDPRTGEEVLVVRAFGRTFYAPPGPTCAPRDDICEINRIWDFLVLNCRYVFDPADVDTFATLKETLLAGGGDCFPEGTLLFTDRGELKPVDAIQPGERIWGRDRWSEVTRKWYKGALPVTAIRLNNGAWLRLTADHKVYVGVCHRHASRKKCAPCSCQLEDREIVRIPVSELEPGMVLLQPGSIDAPNETLSSAGAALAELTGLYLADGWLDGSRVCISGKDGHVKEAQKRRVVELAGVLGLNTSWHERYVRINSQDLVNQFADLGGSHASLKRFNTLRPTLQMIPFLLNGLNADSGKNTNGPGYTFSTTSRTLAIQTRLLHRMQSTSCGLSRIDNHGGLGNTPIYRLTPRLSVKGRNKLLRVKEIERDLISVPCYDISTDDHYVYLPEHDVTVSNCDDATIAFAALLGSIGFRVNARVISTPDDPNTWVHIYPLVGLPKDRPTRWMPLDITVDGALPGWEYDDIAKAIDYSMV